MNKFSREYPVNIELFKISTKSDAEIPQEIKYPSGNIISKGFMFEHTLPKKHEVFYVLSSKIHPIFRTSKVLKIGDKGSKILIETLNSNYEIRIIDINEIK